MSDASTPRPAGPRKVDRDSPLPLWVQVLDDLRSRLAVGEFTDEFPGEMAFVAQYAVSRHTVREALRRMRSEGIVTAQRGRTSRLAAPAEIEQPLGTMYSLYAAVEASGRSQRSVVRTLDVLADGVVAARLGLEESTPLVFLERLRLADGAPLAIDRAWLPARRASPLLEADFTRTALYTELRKRCGIRLTSGRESIRAVVATDSERSLLEMPEDVAALAVERIGLMGDEAVEWRHTVVRGDRFAVSVEFSGRTGYRMDVTGAGRLSR